MILKEQIGFYRVCFDSMQLGILVCDSNGAVKLTNKPLECILGFTEAELLLSNAKDFFSTDSIFHDFLMNYNDEKYHQQRRFCLCC